MADFTLADYKIQAYLLANAKTLAEKTGRTAEPDATTNPQSIFIRKAANDNNSSNISNLNELIANETTEKEKITFVDQLPSYIRATITPYVNIYKTFIDGDKEVDIRLTPGRGAGYRPAGKTEGIQATNQLSNPGVNIESIEINRLGGNPAEIDTNITFKLTLRALRLGHFFDRQVATAENLRKNFEGEIPERIRKQIAHGVAWIDLIKIDLLEPLQVDYGSITQAPQDILRFGNSVGALFKQTLFEDESINGNFYDELTSKIKVEIGYEPLTEEQLNAAIARMPQPTTTQFGAAGPVSEADIIAKQNELRSRIPDMLEQQKQVFFLNLVQNEIGYDAKQGAQLSIDYVAAGGMSTTTRKTDLLFDPNFLEEELRLNDAKARILDVSPHDDRIGGASAGGIDDLPAIVIDPFARVSGPSFNAQADVRGVTAKLERQTTANLDQYEEEVKTGELNSSSSKEEALNKIQNSIDKLQQIQRNLLINGLYGGALLVANKEDDDEVTGAGFGTQFAQAGVTPRFKSRVYMHFAKTEHVLNYVSNFLSPRSSTNIEPYIQNFGDLFFFSEEDLPGATDNDIPQGELDRYVEDLGNPRSEEDLIGDLTDGDVSNIIDGSEVNIEFTYFGDILETALEVLCANNRFGEGDIDGLTRIFGKSKHLIYAGSNIDKVAKTAFIKPFYWSTENLSVGDFYDRTGQLHKLIGDIATTDITYQSPASPSAEITINLADVPIAMVEFKKWFANNIGGTRRSNYFIKDYINNLLRWVSRLIGDSVNYSKAKTTNVEPPEIVNNKVFLNYDPSFGGMVANETSLFGRVGVDHGELTKNTDDKSISVYPISRIISIANLQDQSLLTPRVLNLLTQTPDPQLTTPVGQTRRARDRELNIPHIIINDSGNGALRRINFSREDMPGLREARLFEGEEFNRTSLIREKYNASIEFEGNNFFKPGTVLYVEPGAVDLGYTNDVNSFARQLGIGGYYYVIRVLHTLYFAGKLDWQTSVETKWQSFGDQPAFDPGNIPGKPDEFETSYLARYAQALDLSDPASVGRLDGIINSYINYLTQFGPKP